MVFAAVRSVLGKLLQASVFQLLDHFAVDHGVLRGTVLFDGLHGVLDLGEDGVAHCCNVLLQFSGADHCSLTTVFREISFVLDWALTWASGSFRFVHINDHIFFIA